MKKGSNICQVLTDVWGDDDNGRKEISITGQRQQQESDRLSSLISTENGNFTLVVTPLEISFYFLF